MNLPQYLYNGQNERVEELNQRIYSRRVPDVFLEPNFDPRSVPTKYSIFPIIDRKIETNPLFYQNYENEFTGSTAPSSGFFENIDNESVLRNQIYAIQKSDDAVYVPSSDSDLYRDPVMYDKFKPGNWKQNNIYPYLSYTETIQPHPALFEEQHFEHHIPFNAIGNNLLYNHTRTQLRNL